MISVLMLNLPRDVERRRRMDDHLRSLGIPYELVSAIDGRAIPDDEALPHMASFRRGHGRDPTKGELGCAFSHLMLFRRIAAGDDEFVCTMEDDIDVSTAALPFLDEAMLRLLPPFDVLRLFSIEERRCKRAWSLAVVQGRRVVVPLRAGWGLQAQVITRSGAAKLAAWSITGPIDSVYHDHPPRGLRIMEVRPSLIQRLDFGSNTSGVKPIRKTPWLKLRAEGYRIKRTLLTRAHFVQTWGLRGLYGLIRAL